jgi:hypothetical protein
MPRIPKLRRVTERSDDESKRLGSRSVGNGRWRSLVETLLGMMTAGGKGCRGSFRSGGNVGVKI